MQYGAPRAPSTERGSGARVLGREPGPPQDTVRGDRRGKLPLLTRQWGEETDGRGAGWRRAAASGRRQWDPEQGQKLCKRLRGLAKGSPCLSSCSAAEPRGAEAALSAVMDGMVQEEINSQAFAGGELGGVSILKILNECARACGVAADTSLKPALPTLFLARFRRNLTASY